MAFTDPEKNINMLEVREGQHIADFGSGSGFYSLATAVKVGDTGRVYAIDVQKEMLEKLKDVALKQNLQNIETVWADIDEVGGSSLADESMDGAIVSNVLFQSEDKVSLAKEVKRTLKPNSKVLLVEWSDSFGNLGPAPDDVVKKEDAINLFTSIGFLTEREFDAGDHHYGVILRKG